MMNIEITPHGSGEVANVALIGDLDDEGGRRARLQLKRAVEAGNIDLMIDLDGVGALESGGLAALIATLRLARDRGGNVRVRASQPHIRRVLELTGLCRVFRLATGDLAERESAA